MPDLAKLVYVVVVVAVSNRSAVAQSITATATALTQMQANAGSSPVSSLPPGTDLSVAAPLSAGFGAWWASATAQASWQLSSAGGTVTYTISESAQTTASQGIITANVGFHETVLGLTSTQPVVGVLTASSAQVGNVQVALDIGNDGTVDWMFASSGAFEQQQLITVAGTTEIRTITVASAVSSILSPGTQTSDTQLTLTFEPLVAGCTQRNGNGVNPLACTCATLPVLATSWDIAIAPGPNTVMTFAFASVPVTAPVPTAFGELLITAPVVAIPGNGTHSVSVPNTLQLVGYELSVQGVRLNAVGSSLSLDLTNAQDAVVGH